MTHTHTHTHHADQPTQKCEKFTGPNSPSLVEPEAAHFSMPSSEEMDAGAVAVAEMAKTQISRREAEAPLEAQLEKRLSASRLPEAPHGDVDACDDVHDDARPQEEVAL
mmetsp:Transcript_6191/g.11073  ORF Transcript_6191/g.11073 Transcript_6191/m.11073 type:complete len:109 (+) Transcript_6191:3-329(+)